MRSPLRHAVLLSAAGCFVAMTSGFVLYLHLHLANHHDHHCDHDPLEHDSEHCSFCQRLLASMKDFVSTVEAARGDIVEGGQAVEVPLIAPRPQTSVGRLQARAPPL